MTSPSAANTLISRLGPGWTVALAQHATGEMDFGGLSEETDGEGKRHRVVNVEPVESYLVRAHHVDGRAFVAVWVSRVLRPTKSGGKSWTLDFAWRARHPDEHTPHEVSKAELDAYIDSGLEGIEQYRSQQVIERRRKREKKNETRGPELDDQPRKTERVADVSGRFL